MVAADLKLRCLHGPDLFVQHIPQKLVGLSSGVWGLINTSDGCCSPDSWQEASSCWKVGHVSVFRGQKGRPDLSADPCATKLDVLTQFCPDQQYQQIIIHILFQNVSLEVSLNAT